MLVYQNSPLGFSQEISIVASYVSDSNPWYWCQPLGGIVVHPSIYYDGVTLDLFQRDRDEFTTQLQNGMDMAVAWGA